MEGGFVGGLLGLRELIWRGMASMKMARKRLGWGREM